MIQHQQDDDGVVSCRHRTAHPRDPASNNWCALSKELCCYNANCLVLIPTPLSEVVNAAEELAEASAGLVRFMERKGYGPWDLAATRTALVAVETALNNLGDDDAPR